MPLDPSYADSISNIESGGKYDAMGPATSSGDRAHGKYQIMGANIGPWTKEILGAEMSPQDFLANPQAQDAVFQGKFGQYVDKYGPEGAAQAWIGGPGGVGKVDRRDSLGTSIGDYGKRFIAGLPNGGQSAPGQPAPSFNAPPQQVASLPAFGWSPGAQAAPAEQPQAAPTGYAQQPGQADPSAQTSMPQLPPMQWMALHGQQRPPDLSRLKLALSQAAPNRAAFSIPRTS